MYARRKRGKTGRMTKNRCKRREWRVVSEEVEVEVEREKRERKSVYGRRGK